MSETKLGSERYEGVRPNPDMFALYCLSFGKFYDRSVIENNLFIRGSKIVSAPLRLIGIVMENNDISIW